MSFKVQARTIFHLGADLISTDSIALYELVKNAFDAGSPDVDIKWVIRVPSAHYFDLQRLLENMGPQPKQSELDALRKSFLDKIDPSAPGAVDLREVLEQSDDVASLVEALDESNYIDVVDTGSGMTLVDLETVYLSIGTPHRLLEKQGSKGKRLILGEKGVGRLAAMRLGHKLRVTTSEKGESHWNVLDVNWRDFRHDLDASLEEIAVDPEQGSKKNDKAAHGTTIHVSALTSSWDVDRVRGVASADIAKLGDPFTKTKFPIVLKFNDEAIKVPKFEHILTDYAHASMEVTFVAEGPNSALKGIIDYNLRKRKTAFKVEQFDLLSVCSLHTFGAFDSLGPFTAKLYWFNRKTLRKLEGSAELQHVINLQDRWAGGLMVYRDGFRVNPYGTGDDDWLDLDRVALSSTGYKLNRRQIVGKVDISSEANPLLQDQTNREGIRDSEERRILVALLQHAILDELKPFLEKCDDEAEEGAPLTTDEIEERVTKQRKRLRAIVKQIKEDYPELAKKTEIVSTIEDAAEKLERLMDQARRQVDAYEEAQDRVIHLAGTGLLVEMVAHELNRATRHTLQILNERGAEASKEMNTMLRTLEAQLKTLQKRLRILDPLATVGRQVKETFDLVSWVEEIVAAHAEQFKRHEIRAEVKVVPARAKECKVKMVKGMLVQVLENLLSNSIYWLNQKASLTKNFSPEIQVVVDTKGFTVSVTDNGPGITQDRRNSVFEPFVTTKPPGKGKGLGLFIAREIARYHKASLELVDEPRKDGTLCTFVLNLGSVAA